MLILYSFNLKNKKHFDQKKENRVSVTCYYFKPCPPKCPSCLDHHEGIMFPLKLIVSVLGGRKVNTKQNRTKISSVLDAFSFMTRKEI